MQNIIDQFVMWFGAMRSLSLLIIGTFVLRYSVLAKFEITHNRIKIHDANFARVDYCYVKAVNRSYKYLSFRIKILQLPLNNVKVNYALLKRSNGYRPYYYNYTVDMCNFLRSSNKHLVNRFVYNTIKDYTNFNHSCPFDQDVIVDKFPTLVTKQFDLLPMPRGEYAFDSRWFTEGILRWESRAEFTFL